jgi:hypothetical protein
VKKKIIIAANSARAFAEAACASGDEVVTLDAFADADLNSIASEAYQVNMQDWQIDIDDFIRQFVKIDLDNVYGFCYASLFDAVPELLNWVATRVPIIGNSAETLKKAKAISFFELLDTFGFPIDLTQLIAREQGMQVDLLGFEKNLQMQKERSRKATSLETEDWVVVQENDALQFIGYDVVEAEVHITRYRKVKAKGKEQFQLVLNQTPFYAESGGQVGDTGTIESANEKIEILPFNITDKAII